MILSLFSFETSFSFSYKPLSLGLFVSEISARGSEILLSLLILSFEALIFSKTSSCLFLNAVSI